MDSLIGFSGLKRGPDAEILGRSRICRELIFSTVELPRAKYTESEVEIVLYVTFEGSLSKLAVEGGVGRCFLDSKYKRFVADIGVELKSLHLPDLEFRKLYSSYIYNAIEKSCDLMTGTGYHIETEQLLIDVKALTDEFNRRSEPQFKPTHEELVLERFFREHQPELLRRVISGEAIEELSALKPPSEE